MEYIDVCAGLDEAFGKSINGKKDDKKKQYQKKAKKNSRRFKLLEILKKKKKAKNESAAMFLTEAANEIVDAVIDECADMDDDEFDSFCEAVEYDDDLVTMFECVIVENEVLFESAMNSCLDEPLYECAFSDEFISLYESAILNEKSHYKDHEAEAKTREFNIGAKKDKYRRYNGNMEWAKDDQHDSRNHRRTMSEYNKDNPTRYRKGATSARASYLKDRADDIAKMKEAQRKRNEQNGNAERAREKSNLARTDDRGHKPTAGEKVSRMADRARNAVKNSRATRVAHGLGTKARYAAKDAKDAAKVGAEVASNHAKRAARNIRDAAGKASSSAATSAKNISDHIKHSARAYKQNAENKRSDNSRRNNYTYKNGKFVYGESVIGNPMWDADDYYNFIAESCEYFLPRTDALYEACLALTDSEFDRLAESIANNDDINYMVENSINWEEYLMETYTELDGNPFLTSLAESYENGEVELEEYEADALAEAINDPETGAVASDKDTVSSGAAVADDLENPDHGEDHDQDDMGRMTTGNKIAGWGTGGAGSGSKNESSVNPFLAGLYEAAEAGDVDLTEDEKEALAEAIDPFADGLNEGLASAIKDRYDRRTDIKNAVADTSRDIAQDGVRAKAEKMTHNRNMRRELRGQSAADKAVEYNHSAKDRKANYKAERDSIADDYAAKRADITGKNGKIRNAVRKLDAKYAWRKTHKADRKMWRHDARKSAMLGAVSKISGSGRGRKLRNESVNVTADMYWSALAEGCLNNVLDIGTIIEAYQTLSDDQFEIFVEDVVYLDEDFDGEIIDTIVETADSADELNEGVGTKLKAKLNGISEADQEKADAIGQKMLAALKVGNQKAANQEAAKLQKILKTKKLKMSPAIAAGMKKALSGGSAKGKKTMKESYSFDDLRAIAEGCDSSVGCGPDAPDHMSKEADQFGTAHGAEDFEDWKDDSCPITGEPEPNENFPSGGSYEDPEYEVDD